MHRTDILYSILRGNSGESWENAEVIWSVGEKVLSFLQFMAKVLSTSLLIEAGLLIKAMKNVLQNVILNF